MCVVPNKEQECIENCVSLLRTSGSNHLAQARAQEAHYSLYDSYWDISLQIHLF